MRVALWADMEGMSGITDHRLCWPAFEHYWEAGRRGFTDEVTALGRGLLDGGASEVVVVNAHGLGWPNVIWQDLPERVVPADDSSWQSGFDAMALVGFHARAGTADGFISHTMVPGLSVTVDGKPVTEAHIWAWLEGLPVLGVAGDHALEPQLDGFLEGTPFLAVKRSTSRHETVPVYADRAGRLGALREFGRDIARRLPTARQAEVRPLVMEMALDPALADLAEGAAGLSRSGQRTLTKHGTVWSADIQPALLAAMQAALRPLLTAQDDLDLSSEQAMTCQDPDKLERLRDYFTGWVHENGA